MLIKMFITVFYMLAQIVKTKQNIQIEPWEIFTYVVDKLEYNVVVKRN